MQFQQVRFKLLDRQIIIGVGIVAADGDEHHVWTVHGRVLLEAQQQPARSVPANAGIDAGMHPAVFPYRQFKTVKPMHARQQTIGI